MQSQSPASKSKICAQVETDGPGLRAKQVLHCRNLRRSLCGVITNPEVVHAPKIGTKQRRKKLTDRFKTDNFVSKLFMSCVVKLLDFSQPEYAEFCKKINKYNKSCIFKRRHSRKNESMS